MNQIYLSFKKTKRKTLLSIITIFLVIQAFSIFPLKFELSIINAVMIYGYFMIGLMLHVVYEKKKSIVMPFVLLTNVFGFLLRVWLEWGESSMIRDFKMSNIWLTYLPICTVIIAGYLYTDRVINPNNLDIK